MRHPIPASVRSRLPCALALAFALAVVLPLHARAHGDREVGEVEASHAGTPEEERGIPWLGDLHPLVVHFPIAMLMGAGLAELLASRTDRRALRDAARFCSWVGALGAIAAAGLGWFAAGLAESGDEWPLTVHRWLGTVTGAWGVALAVLLVRTRDPASRGRGYLAAILLGAALVAATGYFGGLLVHGMDRGHG